MKKLLIISFILIILAIAAYFFFTAASTSEGIVTNQTIKSSNSTHKNLSAQDVIITSLSKHDLVLSLPKDALISLSIGSSQYTIKKSSVTLGKPSNPDMIISIPESYVQDIKTDFCEAIEKAKANGDLSFSLNISQSSALWKYRSIIKYKDCLGL